MRKYGIVVMLKYIFYSHRVPYGVFFVQIRLHCHSIWQLDGLKYHFLNRVINNFNFVQHFYFSLVFCKWIPVFWRQRYFGRICMKIQIFQISIGILWTFAAQIIVNFQVCSHSILIFNNLGWLWVKVSIAIPNSSCLVAKKLYNCPILPPKVISPL